MGGAFRNPGDPLYGDGIAAQFPGQAWDGTSLSTPSADLFRAPDKFDWEQAKAEINAVQEYLLSAGGVPKTAVRTITNAELLAAPLTAYDLAGEPGPGNFYWVQSAILIANLAAAYTNVDGGAAVAIASHDLNMLFVQAPASNFLVSTGPVIFPIAPSGLEVGLSQQTYSDNQPLSFALSNGSSGALTGGDPANYVIVVVRYIIYPGPT